MKEKKKEKTEEPKASTVKGKPYICKLSHDEPCQRADGGIGFISRLLGETHVFTKDPGPNWRPVTMAKTEEV